MIEFLSILITIVLFCYFLNYKNKKDRAEKEMDSIANAPNMSVSAEVLPLNKNDMKENQNISTRDLCVEILRKLNCEVQFDEENEYTMFFTYQGENFRIDTWKDCLMIGIWDTWWGSVDLDDFDDICHIRKAINTININSFLTMVYSIDQEGQRFLLFILSASACWFRRFQTLKIIWRRCWLDSLMYSVVSGKSWID